MKIHFAIMMTAMISISMLACQSGENKEAEKVQTGSGSEEAATGLPELNMYNLNGETVALENFSGKKLFVNLWASWCPPYKREMPSIEQLYQSVDTSRVAFVMLSLDDDFEKAKAFLLSMNSKLPAYYPAGKLPSLFNVESIPTTYIFDETGKLIHHVNGSDDYNTEQYRAILK